MALSIELKSQISGEKNRTLGEVGRPVVIDPSKINLLPKGMREWFNSDGTAKSASEADRGKTVVGPDDGDKLD